MWRYDLRGRRHRQSCENQGRHDVMSLLKSMKKSILVRWVNLSRVKAKLAGIKNVDSVFIHAEYIRVARRSHSNGDIVRHLGFLNIFFAYWRSIREVYSVIDRLHVTCFSQSVFDILVQGEIKYYIRSKHPSMSRYITCSWPFYRPRGLSIESDIHVACQNETPITCISRYLVTSTFWHAAVFPVGNNYYRFLDFANCGDWDVLVEL